MQRTDATNSSDSFDLVGESLAFLKAIDRAKKIAPTESTVLVLGESGTGKELLVRMIHFSSWRKAGPLICVNCAAIPDALLESELFGHVRGAFTGALKNQPGKFALADGGTLFLDEIGEMPMPMQAKLLRVLQKGEYWQIGGQGPASTNVRLVAATNQNLSKAVGDGRFRQDLYYRLAVFPIGIPPLRKRKSDIPLILAVLLRRHHDRIPSHLVRLSQGALGRLQAYDWPGNVRELENTVQRLRVLCQHDEATESEVRAAAELDSQAISDAYPSSDCPMPSNATADEVHSTFLNCGRNVSETARRLGLSRQTTQRRLRELRLR